jgi:hypothetical protein
MRSLFSALLVAAALMGTTHIAHGGFPPSALGAVTGLNSDLLPVVKLFSVVDPDGCWLEALVDIPSGNVGSAHLRMDNGVPTILITFNSGEIIKIPRADFFEVCPEKREAAARPRSGPSPSATPVAIPISNDADSLTTSCDGRFAVVVGSTFFSQTNTPVSLVDLNADEEVATVAYPDRLGYYAAIGDDGQTVLVSLQDQTGGGAPPTVRRLTLDSTNGTLTDAGVELAFDSNDFLTHVRVAPGSDVGVALVEHFQAGTTELVSFSLPDLTIQDSVTLAGVIGSSVVFNCAGDKLYARSGSQALEPDVIQGFDFDPLTGTIANAAFLTINDISIFYGARYGDPLAISSDGALLIAAEENEDGRLPEPRVSMWDAVTGTFVDAFASPDVPPHLAAAVPCCALGPTPTPTPTATPSPTATPRATPRPRPTPHPRPTPR